ncbi:hypothetical protein AAHA92_24761 [Salvia divinorum]|uniref:Uncharacterized protein n=1 Tax=Salvia divinorum TaxID=28513 RepID=A0ABD1G8J6_SALDI
MRDFRKYGLRYPLTRELPLGFATSKVDGLRKTLATGTLAANSRTRIAPQVVPERASWDTAMLKAMALAYVKGNRFFLLRCLLQGLGVWCYLLPEPLLVQPTACCSPECASAIKEATKCQMSGLPIAGGNRIPFTPKPGFCQQPFFQGKPSKSPRRAKRLEETIYD